VKGVALSGCGRGKDHYHADRFVALENLDDSSDNNSAWESI